jgi:hypothetical protein
MIAIAKDLPHCVTYASIADNGHCFLSSFSLSFRLDTKVGSSTFVDSF